MFRSVLTLALLFSAPAFAAPPPKDSEDWKIMQPYTEWVTGQHDNKGRWCCDIGDGRPVDSRITGEHWEAHVTWEHFPGLLQVCGGPIAGPGSMPCQPMGPNGVWLEIPTDKITRNANPIGTAILWLFQSRVQCFAPPDGV